MADYKKLFKIRGGNLVWRVSRGRKASGSVAGTDHGDGYKTVRIDGKAHYVHRIIKQMRSRKRVSGDVDHKNRRRADNRPGNLRTLTRSKNNRNRKSWSRKK